MPSSPSNPIAPRWHTALLALLVVSVAATGTWLAGATARGSAVHAALVATVYFPGIVVACGLALYVSAFFTEEGALGTLIGQRWTSRRRALGDVALAAVAFVGIEACHAGVAFLREGSSAHASASVLPVTQLERAVWVVFALAAGVSEELVYRGYFRVQLAAFARSEAVGIIAQAALFGVAHLDQGPVLALVIGGYGLALGVLTSWRGSLLPAMIAHVGVDLASGLSS